MFEGLFMPSHLILVLAIVLIVFGPGKLPELGGTVGRSIRDFKKRWKKIRRRMNRSASKKRLNQSGKAPLAHEVEPFRLRIAFDIALERGAP
jgi:TatA/E family protein of Tat protein translocase